MSKIFVFGFINLLLAFLFMKMSGCRSALSEKRKLKLVEENVWYRIKKIFAKGSFFLSVLFFLSSFILLYGSFFQIIGTFILQTIHFVKDLIRIVIEIQASIITAASVEISCSVLCGSLLATTITIGIHEVIINIVKNKEESEKTYEKDVKSFVYKKEYVSSPLYLQDYPLLS